MFLRNSPWLYMFLKPEGEGDGSGGAGGDAGGVGAGGEGEGAAGGGGERQALNYRSEFASALEGEDRAGFEKWANNYSTDAEFAKATWNMRREFDARVPLPKPDSKPEEIDKFYQRIGKPPSPDKYAYDFGKGEDGKPRQLSDDDAARFERWREHAHKNNYTQQHFEAGLKFLEEDMAQQETQASAMIERARADAEKQLKADWGPDYEANLAASQDAGAAYADDPKAWQTFVNLPLAGGGVVGDHPTLLRMMAKIGRASAEDQHIRNMHQSGEATNIKAEIERLERESGEKGYSTANGPHAARLEELYRQLYPKKHMGGQGMGFGA